MPVNIVFELFDTFIKPILLYACEIWGSKMGKDIEKMHINFSKTVLALNPLQMHVYYMQKQDDLSYMLLYTDR